MKEEDGRKKGAMKEEDGRKKGAKKEEAKEEKKEEVQEEEELGGEEIIPPTPSPPKILEPGPSPRCRSIAFHSSQQHPWHPHIKVLDAPRPEPLHRHLVPRVERDGLAPR